MSANITEVLSKMQDLTNQNLEILTTLNEAFHTKREYLTLKVNDTTYNVPSFVSLQNQLNTLKSNFENLVEAPKTGTANFIFDGNTRSIQCGGFNICPDAVTLQNVSEFNIDYNDVLKDFMTPMPYLKFNIGSISNHVTNVLIKKVVLFNNDLIDVVFPTKNIQSKSISFAEMDGHLLNYTEDVDYQVYDTFQRLPLRENIGRGDFHINEIIDEHVDDSFTQTYRLKLDTLMYVVDSISSKMLKVGDKFVSNDDECLLEITNINDITNIVDVKVLNNGYSNIMTYAQSANAGTLKFHSSIDFDLYKYVKVALEENQYVIIFISPIYDSLNTRAEWSNGIAINTYNLTVDVDGESYYFRDYYNKYVTNIGDGVMNLTSMMGDMLSNYSREAWTLMKNARPVIDASHLTVTQINSHISNSESYKNIKQLYANKQSYKNELTTLQAEIDNINNTLASIDFDDTSNTRQIYENQLKSLNARKIELNTSINTIVKEISLNATNSDLSIDGAKYHIRGFFDCQAFMDENHINSNIIGIKVLYRYKNATKNTGTSLTLENFTYSDWNAMPVTYKLRKPSEYNLTNYLFDYDASVEDASINPVFNQIDIPISQGETVDIKLCVVYEPGYPFVEFTSDWSDILNVEFPEQYTQNVTILDIIEENNEDVKSYQFESLLESTGIQRHVDNQFLDQDVQFMHRPENISSGFFTAERRVVPLRDKLMEMNTMIAQLRDELFGGSVETMSVSIVDDTGYEQSLEPFAQNIFQCVAFADNNNVVNNTNNLVKYQILNIKITNNSTKLLKLFSQEFGSSTQPVDKDIYKTFDLNEPDKKIAPVCFTTNRVNTTQQLEMTNVEQTKKQIVYFYGKNSFTGYNLFDKNTSKFVTRDTKAENGITIITNPWNNVVSDYYIDLKNPTDVQITDSSVYYKTIGPNESITIPVIFEYKLSVENAQQTTQTMQFSVKPSNYKDAIVYEVTMQANYQDDIASKVKRASQSSSYRTTVM